jgi:hypothetical protein
MRRTWSRRTRSSTNQSSATYILSNNCNNIVLAIIANGAGGGQTCSLH